MSTVIMFLLYLWSVIPLLRFIVLLAVRFFGVMVGIIAGMIA